MIRSLIRLLFYPNVERRGFLYRILLIEDIFDVRESVKDYFSLKGKDRFKLDLTFDFWDGMNKIRTEPYDIVILDVRLCIQTGADFCTLLSQHCPYPVMFILDMDDEEEVAYAIEMSPSSLILKPVEATDVYEQVSDYLNETETPSFNQMLEYSGIMMNPKTGHVTVDGTYVNLTGKASSLLCVLLENTNSVVSREMLLKRIWGEDFCGSDRVVDSQIRMLRKQLGEKGNLIRTEKGEGYIIGGKQ
ncbi:MAG: response regulator transcription factor [Clostridiales bacterium]|nr:response regulator transcription factor [Clostridiales bacterium]